MSGRSLPSERCVMHSGYNVVYTCNPSQWRPHMLSPMTVVRNIPRQRIRQVPFPRQITSQGTFPRQITFTIKLCLLSDRVAIERSSQVMSRYSRTFSNTQAACAF